MGTRALEKRKMEKTIEEILEYGLNNLGEENLSETLANRFLQEFPTMNERDIEIEISDTIHITVFKRYTRSLLKNQTLELSYEGEIINGKVQIVKE